MNELIKDRVYGMLISHAVGDALGALHEFNRNEVFNGYCNRSFSIFNRFNGSKTSAIGQTTDDNTMTLVLLKVICYGYSVDKAVKSYIEWASIVSMLGRNTRALFCGIKTTGDYMKTYQRHLQKVLESGPLSQSNGCLMRCSPISIIRNFSDRRNITIYDCQITNTSSICVYSNIIYIEILHSFLYNGVCNIDEILNSLIMTGNESIISDFRNLWVSSQQSNWNQRVVNGKDKGWVIHALFFAFVAVTYNDGFINFMRILTEMGGDTDTNMAIAGAVFGARFGYSYLFQDSYFRANVEIILNSDWSTSDMIKSDSSVYFHPRNINMNEVENIVNVYPI